MVAPDGTHLTGPAVCDTQNTLGRAFENFGSGGVQNDRLNAKERSGCRAGLQRGCARQRCQQVTTGFGLPPRVNDRRFAFADNVVVPVPCFGVDRFTHGAEGLDRRQVILFDELGALAHQSADRGRRGVELVDLVLFADSPEATSVGVGGNTFEH